MKWSDKLYLEKLLDRPRVFRTWSVVPGRPLQKKMVMLSGDYHLQYMINDNQKKFVQNRKKD